MESRTRNHDGDETNAAFGIPEAQLEELSPGLDIPDAAYDHVEDDESASPRRRPAERREIPTATLAERLRTTSA